MSKPDSLFKADEYARLRAAVIINPLDLDNEWTNLPMLVMEAGEFCAIAIKRRDAAKGELADASNASAAKLRSVLVDGKKRSEAQIESEKMLAPAVVDAQLRFEQRKSDVDRWAALVEALRVKQSSLKHISELIVAGYLTRDSFAKNHRPVTDAATRAQVNDNIRKRLAK